MAIIELLNINKFYGIEENRVHILKDINLKIEKGDFVSIIGQSGSGKSTLMNIIGCLDTPTSGSYMINGIAVQKMNPEELAELRCKTFGFIFQRYNLLSNLSAVDNVILPAVYEGIGENIRLKRAEELLNDMGLSHRLLNKPNEMSGGEQQRVSISRALMNGGEIILADEPTGALDSKTGEKVMAILKELHQKGHTIVLVTHDKAIAALASRTIEIKDGKILRDTRRENKIYAMPFPLIKTQKGGLNLLKDRFLESLKMSVQTIVSHKMRSVLTMLGIIIGVSSLVSTISLGQGSQAMIIDKISEMGSNTISINPGKSFGDMESDKVTTLVPRDAELLLKQPYIQSATPEVSTTSMAAYQNKTAMMHLSGIGEQFFNVTNGKILKGRNLTAEDIKDVASVVVVDEKVVKEFFDGKDPIGKILVVDKKPLKIVGIGEQPVMFGPYANMMTLWTPYTTAMKKITGMKHIHVITVRVADGVSSQTAEKNIIKLLTDVHGVKDFFTMNSDTVEQTLKDVTGILRLLISGIALIALMVGGIGVMNIMLVSVTERTKEIGIRMAIGAKQSDILGQFLIEAVIICLLGGIIGVGISLLAGLAANSLLDFTIMPFTLPSIFAAFASSSITGILFGFMPAKNASKLNPIEALQRD